MTKLSSGIKGMKNSLNKKYSFSRGTVIALSLVMIVLLIMVIANSCYRKVLNSTINAFKKESFVDYDDEYDDEYAEYYSDYTEDEYDDDDVESDVDSDVESDDEYDTDDEDEMENFNQKCNFHKKGPIKMKKGLKIGTFDFDKNRIKQELTFDLKLSSRFIPMKIWRNIIQFGKDPKLRLPAIYVRPNTNQIHVTLGQNQKGKLVQGGKNTKMKLEKNKKYAFKFIRKGRLFTLKINGKVVAKGKSPIVLPHPKNVPIFVSHPKYETLGAGTVSNVCMKFTDKPKKIPKKIPKKTTSSSLSKPTKSMPRKKSSSKSSSSGKSLGVMAVATLPVGKPMNLQDGPEFFTGKYAPAL